MDDGRVVAAQIERPLRSAADVVVRCPLGLPVVTRVPPVLDDGTPFPTSYWLCCPLAVRRIGRIESAGGGAVPWNGTLRPPPPSMTVWTLPTTAMPPSATQRCPPDAPHPPSGGVGGTESRWRDQVPPCPLRRPRRGNDNPVGEAVAPFVEPLDCTVACVVEVDGEVVRNPAWREPK